MSLVKDGDVVILVRPEASRLSKGSQFVGEELPLTSVKKKCFTIVFHSLSYNLGNKVLVIKC